MFWKRKKKAEAPDQRRLFEMDPKDLDLTLLHHMQGALIAKLLLVNREAVSRYEELLATSDLLAENQEKRQTLEAHKDKLCKINRVLESELSQFTEHIVTPTRH
jgi:hypothetical protein